ncbi:L-seryl-tRNA(Sec) selenium transferase [Inediibacterium massiliense]|uniref:L-seryl-tRNA(Sec) selenium transferase n=1 Tax=Inediibacterium massiliense TaxID=1658111 RepID=UPI0006B4FF50|nr:L-seryl-tRNA(Sec) selenium transferase [Inediibacterium massiliense]
MSTKKEMLASIPKVDQLLSKIKIQNLLQKESRNIIVESIREVLDEIRIEILKCEDHLKSFHIDDEILQDRIIQKVKEKNKMNLKKVVNATGVVLHTNLGRALLSSSIKEEVWEIASSYSNLEYDVKLGKRGSRYDHIENLLVKLTKAESAIVVNNNAAAVFLVLNTLAKNKEVIVSRGQLVEIGGSFRIPDVMEQSGANLVEVGTTNKTHLFDYEKNITEDTAALLKVHTSNYKILGFTQDVDLKELVHLGKKYHIPVIEDIGSGTLIDFSKYGLFKEPTVCESIISGADIVTFSGDKLLGGPQAGMIIGKKEYIDKMKKNPYTRAFRVDKLTLAALEATLKIYLDEEKAIKEIPTLHMLTMDIKEIHKKAEILYNLLNENIKDCQIEKTDGFSQVGGGSMPLETLPTILIRIKCSEISSNEFEYLLRSYEIPIITRIHEDYILLDVRTIHEDEFLTILKGVEAVLSKRRGA